MAKGSRNKGPADLEAWRAALSQWVAAIAADAPELLKMKPDDLYDATQEIRRAARSVKRLSDLAAKRAQRPG